MKNLTRLFKSKAASINEKLNQATFVISDESVDRQGEIIKQDGWDFENFKANPVILFGHDSYDLPIGKAVDIYTEGTQTFAVIEFAVDIYEKAAIVWNMIKAGILNTVSVGFINQEYDNETLTKNELLEISIVPVPANPNAVVLAAKDGLISKKDAQFLVKQYEKELEGLRTLAADDKVEGMEQLQQFITDALQPINDKLAALEASQEKVDGVVNDVAEIKTELAKLADGSDKPDASADDKGDEDGKGGEDDKDDLDADGKPSKKPGGTDEAGDEVDPDNLTDEQAEQVSAAVASALAEE